MFLIDDSAEIFKFIFYPIASRGVGLKYLPFKDKKVMILSSVIGAVRELCLWLSADACTQQPTGRLDVF